MRTPIEDLRKSVDSFADEMMGQLVANRGKGHWADCPSHFLIDELNKNLNYLAASVEEGDKDTVRRRAANVANFAMMIADNRDKQWGYDERDKQPTPQEAP